jgi:hypothetical protein
MADKRTSTVTERRFDPEEMALRGRIGAHVSQSRHDPRILTASARAAFLAKFEREADPDGTLPEEERRRRAEHARKAYFARLALASARARRASQVCDAADS